MASPRARALYTARRDSDRLPQALGGRGLVYAAVYVVAVGARDAHGETPEGIAVTGATS